MFNDHSKLDSVNFEDNINFLTKTIDDDLYNGIQYQDETMSSNSFNATMSLFELNLDHMYEKFRVLEDTLAYGKEYISQKIINSTKQSMAILNVIEEDRNSLSGNLKNSSYISYEIPFIESSGAYIDRDNTELQRCSVINGVLTLSGQTMMEVPYKSIKKVSNYVPYKSNIDELKNKNPYRAFYVLDSIVADGIKEAIQIEFEEPTIINCMDIETSKCSVSNMTYIYENGSEELEDNIKTGITKYRKIKAVKFVITSNRYKKISYAVDASRMKENFWDVIKEAVYNLEQGKTTIFDLEEITGLKKHSKDYSKYVSDLEKWKSEKDKAEKEAIKYKQDYDAYLKAKAEYDNKLTQYQKDLIAWKKKYGK